MAKSEPISTVAKLLYRRQEAAFALGLPLREIDYLISQRRLTSRRYGRRVMIPAADVNRVAQEILSSTGPRALEADRSAA